MSEHFETLLGTIDILRNPGGCPWDQKQSLLDAARFLMDEGGELVEAALAGDEAGCEEELGDLLFMTSFCTRILSETRPVDMHDIARIGNEKLVRRHPHVFGDTSATSTSDSQQQWEAIKAQEKRAKGIDPDHMSALKDMPASTAPLHQAYNYQKNAASVGFDWPDVNGVWEKLREEEKELMEAIESGDRQAMEHELGDFLFSVVNVARWLKIQPDMALRQANNRFRSRFHLVEDEYKGREKTMLDAPIDELEASWQRAKQKLAEQ